MDPFTPIAHCFPCKWPESRDDGWLSRMAALRAVGINIVGEVEDFVQGTAISLNNFLRRVAVPMGFKPLKWNPQIENKLKLATIPESQWANLKANGVWGCKFPFDEDTVVVDDWDELIGLLANLMAGVKAMCAKS